MERNENLGPTGETQVNTGPDGLDQQPSKEFDFAGAGTPGTDQNVSLQDRARDAAGTAKERLANVGSTVRERASGAKSRLADVIESGADRLRERGTTGTPDTTLAGATNAGTTALPNDGRTAQVSDRVAGGMQATADWLREADLDSLRNGIEQQVREHPGRTLLIALGLGYVIGRAVRNP